MRIKKQAGKDVTENWNSLKGETRKQPEITIRKKKIK